MNIILLVFLLGTLVNETKSSYAENSTVVAVCITGQFGRIVTNQLYNGLIRQNPNFKFKIFLNMQHNDKAIYVLRSRVPAPNPLDNKTIGDIKTILIKSLTHINSEVAGFRVSKARTLAEWKVELNRTQLNVVTQFRKEQHVILNMYSQHSGCKNMVTRHIHRNNLDSDHVKYLIWGREDAYFFKSLNMTKLIGILSQSPTSAIMTKDCLGWGGLSMRFHIFKIQDGLQFLNKLEHYVNAVDKDLTFKNPEMFEMYITKQLQLRVYNMSVEDLPVVGARYSFIDSEPCFMHQELKEYAPSILPPCVPQASMEFAILRLCPHQSGR